MSNDLLFEHFATLATAPDGIARLRELILLFAVQGKLGTNNPKELPLTIDESKKRIRNVKSQDGESSRTQIIDVFPPDSIPKNWRKTSLGSVGIWSTGGTPSRQVSNYFDGGIPWIKSGDLNDGIVTKTDETISQLGLDNSNAKLLPKGTISIALYGATIGKLGILGIESTTNQACANCVINEKIITTRYLFYFLRSQKSYFIQVGQGGAQPNITNWIIWEWPIVIPPLNEQHRIIEKIDRLMALCDELEARQQQERAGCLRLGTASLAGLQNAESTEEFDRQWAQVCDAFDMILDCPENVTVLRQTFLQLAVQGRLVRQEPGDEPVGKLVDRIRKEKERLVKEGKSKQEEPLGKIKEMKIPDAWQLCHLGEISEIIMGNSPPGETYNSSGDGVPLINGPTEFSKPPLGKTIISQYTTQPTKFCKENDLLICVRGATTGRTNIAGFDACVGRGVAVIRSPSIQSYLNLFILTKAQQILDMGTGSTFPSISQNDLLTIQVPLPPLAEQHRIVARVDALMALCDALESQLKERAGVQGRLANAIVKNVADA